MDVVVSGASGLVGTALVDALGARGDRAVRLVRPGGRSAGRPGGDTIAWDPASGTIDAAALEGLDAVVHLAGVGIAEHRWTDSHKQALLDSRVQGTTLLATTLAGLQRPPRVMVSASAIGAYGDRGDEVLTETSPVGTGFLAELCATWEAAASPAEAAGIRVPRIRSGIVLTPKGGALRKQLPLFKVGLGGRFGNGHQWQSWISLDDEVGAILHLLSAERTGPVNLTAPNPVTNAEFTSTLAHVLHRPAVLPIPRFGPSLLLGSELAGNLLYAGQRVLPAVLEAHGYTFVHPTLDAALHDLLARPHAA